jgi:hypothetical protein
MTRRCLAAYLGALVVIAWAVLTAIAYARRERPVPTTRYWESEDGIQGADPYSVTLTSASGSFRYYDGWPPYPPRDINN